MSMWSNYIFYVKKASSSNILSVSMRRLPAVPDSVSLAAAQPGHEAGLPGPGPGRGQEARPGRARHRGGGRHQEAGDGPLQVQVHHAQERSEGQASTEIPPIHLT